MLERGRNKKKKKFAVLIVELESCVLPRLLAQEVGYVVVVMEMEELLRKG